MNSGVAEANDILAGDFRWNGADDTLTNIAAICACELAAYFRGPRGGAAASLDAVKAHSDARNAQDAARAP